MFSRSLLFAAACCILGVSARAEAIKLKDGSVIQGTIVRREDSAVVIASPALGEVRVNLASLSQPESAAAAASGAAPGKAHGADPSGQALFFLPTAFTPPAGSFTFRDFELLFLTFGFSPTGSTSMTAGFLFPVTSEAQLLTVGLKQRLWISSGGNTAAALTGNLTRPIGDLADVGRLFLNTNAVFSHRMAINPGGPADGCGIHAALGYLAIKDGDEPRWRRNFTMGLGGELRISDHAKLMVEYLSAAPFDAEEEFQGLVTFGFRLHGERLAADIAGIRPITHEDLGSFFAFPLLTVSYRI